MWTNSNCGLLFISQHLSLFLSFFFQQIFGCRDHCRVWNCISHSLGFLDEATLHSCLMEALTRGNFQVASSGYCVCGTDWVEPLSQGRATASDWPGVVLFPSSLILLQAELHAGYPGLSAEGQGDDHLNTKHKGNQMYPFALWWLGMSFYIWGCLFSPGINSVTALWLR